MKSATVHNHPTKLNEKSDDGKKKLQINQYVYMYIYISYHFQFWVVLQFIVRLPRRRRNFLFLALLLDWRFHCRWYFFRLYSNTFHCIQCVETKPFSPIYNIKVRFLTFLQYFFRGRFLYLSSLIFPLHQERSHNQSVSNFLDSLKRNDSRL